MSYQRDREEFISRMTREGLPLGVVRKLLAGATTMQRYAELACSSEAADRDRVPCPGVKHTDQCLCDYDFDADQHNDIPRITLLDHRLEWRLAKAMPDGWAIVTQGDPRGYVLRVIPPSYQARNEGKDRHNIDSVGVPSGPTRVRF